VFFKINNSFFLDEEDIGNLVCVKIQQHYYNSIDVYDNCLVIDAIYTDSNIRPSQIVFLKESGFILKLNMNYNASIEVKNLSSIKELKSKNDKNRFFDKYERHYNRQRNQ
jgi:hypothetical protein